MQVVDAQGLSPGLLVYRTSADGSGFDAARPAELRECEQAVVKVTASWCGPCRSIQPHFLAQLQANPAVTGYVLDVDDASQAGGDLNTLCEALGADALPTFILFNRGKEVQRFVGGDLLKLEQLFAACKLQPQGESESPPTPSASRLQSELPLASHAGA